MRFAELKTKEVVSVKDGKKLGFVEDLIIDEVSNAIVALRIPKPSRGFKKPEYLEVPFTCISKIGENVILVNEFLAQSSNLLAGADKGEYCYTPKVFHKSTNLPSKKKV